MAKQNRTPLQVSPDFKKKLDDLQKKIMMSKGQKISLRELTDEIIKSPIFDDIENKILKTGDVKMDIKIKLDRRMFG